MATSGRSRPTDSHWEPRVAVIRSGTAGKRRCRLPAVPLVQQRPTPTGGQHAPRPPPAPDLNRSGIPGGSGEPGAVHAGTAGLSGFSRGGWHFKVPALRGKQRGCGLGCCWRARVAWPITVSTTSHERSTSTCPSSSLAPPASWAAWWSKPCCSGRPCRAGHRHRTAHRGPRRPGRTRRRGPACGPQRRGVAARGVRRRRQAVAGRLLAHAGVPHALLRNCW